MELEELEKCAQQPGETGIRAQHVLQDMNLVLAQVVSPAHAATAVETLQKWASEDGEGLRKAVATSFLARARAALGHTHAGGARIVRPGHQMTHSAGLQDRFAHRPAPRIEHDTQPSPRMEAPAHQPGVHAATMSAHTSGSRLAAVAAKHGFKLGLAASAAGGAAVGHAVHGKGKSKKGEEPAEKVLLLEGMEKNWADVLAAGTNPFGSGLKGYIEQKSAQTRAAHAAMRQPKACPTCGQPMSMGKHVGAGDLEKGGSMPGKMPSMTGARANPAPLAFLNPKASAAAPTRLIDTPAGRQNFTGGVSTPPGSAAGTGVAVANKTPSMTGPIANVAPLDFIDAKASHAPGAGIKDTDVGRQNFTGGVSTPPGSATTPSSAPGSVISNPANSARPAPLDYNTQRASVTPPPSNPDRPVGRVNFTGGIATPPVTTSAGTDPTVGKTPADSAAAARPAPLDAATTKVPTTPYTKVPDKTFSPETQTSFASSMPDGPNFCPECGQPWPKRDAAAKSVDAGDLRKQRTEAARARWMNRRTATTPTAGAAA